MWELPTKKLMDIDLSVPFCRGNCPAGVLFCRTNSMKPVFYLNSQSFLIVFSGAKVVFWRGALKETCPLFGGNVGCEQSRRGSKQVVASALSEKWSNLLWLQLHLAHSPPLQGGEARIILPVYGNVQLLEGLTTSYRSVTSLLETAAEIQHLNSP